MKLIYRARERTKAADVWGARAHRPLSALILLRFVRFSTQHQTDAQFARDELVSKLAGAGLVVDDKSVEAGRSKALGVVRKGSDAQVEEIGQQLAVLLIGLGQEVDCASG